MFYQKNVQDVFSELEASPTGLTSKQVEQRQQQYGKNELAEKKKDSPLKIFLKQFQDLLVIILIIAAIISGTRSNGKYYRHRCRHLRQCHSRYRTDLKS